MHAHAWHAPFGLENPPQRVLENRLVANAVPRQMCRPNKRNLSTVAFRDLCVQRAIRADDHSVDALCLLSMLD